MVDGVGDWDGVGDDVMVVAMVQGSSAVSEIVDGYGDCTGPGDIGMLD